MLTSDEIQAAELGEWRHESDSLLASFQTGDFATGAELVAQIAAAAELANHHPDITLTYPKVEVLLTTHDSGGVTSKDVELARSISGLAHGLGVAAG